VREHEETKECGLLPVMVRVSPPGSAFAGEADSPQSIRCNISGLSASDLVKHGEESSSFGGYFIVNGNEKIIRYLIVPRRHHPISIFRTSFTKRGIGYTAYGCQIRCVRPDQSACTNTIHYLSNGGATLRFAWRKVEYMIPLVLILKALVDASDREVFEGLVQGEYHNTFLIDRVELLLRGQKTWGLHTGAQCLDYLGDKFRVVLNCSEDWSNIDVGTYLLSRVVLVHLPSPRDKFRMLMWVHLRNLEWNAETLRQIHATQAVLARVRGDLRGQPGLTTTSRGPPSRISVWHDRERALRRLSGRCQSADSARCSAEQGKELRRSYVYPHDPDISLIRPKRDTSAVYWPRPIGMSDPNWHISLRRETLSPLPDSICSRRRGILLSPKSSTSTDT